MTDPFRYYVKSYSDIKKHQSDEFKHAFHAAVDAIRDRKIVESNRFGKTETKEK